MDILNYSGKRVMVTGCASGIGLATARLLLDQGAEVHGLDRRDPGLALGTFDTVDLGDTASIDAVLAKREQPVDVLFNCAGLGPTHAPLDVIKVNFLGTRYLTERVAERMVAGAAIVSVASVGGIAWRDRAAAHRAFVATGSFDAGIRWFEEHQGDVANAYAFSKEALIVWTLLQSRTLIARNIRINSTSPGVVQTAMLDEIADMVPAASIDAVAVPVGRRSSAQEQAWPLLMLGSELASYINGVDLSVDGGFAGMTMVGGEA